MKNLTTTCFAIVAFVVMAPSVWPQERREAQKPKTVVRALPMLGVTVSEEGDVLVGSGLPLGVREDGGYLLVVKSEGQESGKPKEHFLAFPLDDSGKKSVQVVTETGPGCKWFKTEREAGGGADGRKYHSNIQETFIVSAGPLKGHVLCVDEQKRLVLRSPAAAPFGRTTRYEAASAAELPHPQKRVLGGEIITSAIKNVAESINGLAFDLYRELGKQEGNLFYSPVSISSALAMIYAGADGESKKEMAQVLHFDRNPDQLSGVRNHKAYGKLTNLLNSGGFEDGYVLRAANRLWGQKSYEFLPDFLKITREQYGAELAKVDFGKTEAARQEINTWVEQQTKNKIKDLIPSGLLRSDTRLVLTNAIYFLGKWEHVFSETATKQSPFFVTPQQNVEVPLMTQTEFFRYGESDDVQILELPYRGHEISMVILLPKARDGLLGFEEKLTADNERKWSASPRSQNVQVFLPKFKMTSEFTLNDTLSAMGMPTPFTGAADFSKMSSGGGLSISHVVHKAFVNVNETGTEAAAATAGVMRLSLPVVFRANHPFVFLLRDNRSGTVLFVGRVANPA